MKYRRRVSSLALAVFLAATGYFAEQLHAQQSDSNSTNKSTSTTVLTSSANLLTYGSSVTFTATVTPSEANGTVTFKDGTTTLGTGKLDSGKATYSTSTLAAGSHSITASYSGDMNYRSSASSALTQIVKADLESILSKMDETATGLRNVEASFVWEQYQKVVDETDTQKGKIYFRRVGRETQMAVDVTDPVIKCVLYANGKIQFYQPKIDQVTTYDTSKNRDEFESYLVLGFGSGGHDILKSFDVKFQGTEKLNGAEAAKLDLVPKAVKVRNTFSHIILWIDPAQGVSVQQKFIEPTGDYRLTKYSDIHMNQKLPDGVFKLKTTSKTKFVSPQG